MPFDAFGCLPPLYEGSRRDDQSVCSRSCPMGVRLCTCLGVMLLSVSIDLGPVPNRVLAQLSFPPNFHVQSVAKDSLSVISRNDRYI